MLVRIALVLLTLAGLVVFGVGWLLSRSPDPCDNDVVAEVRSPQGGHRLVVFVRGCGATTSNSTQVSLLTGDERLDNEGVTLLVLDNNHGAAPIAPHGGPFVEAQWIDEHTVLLRHYLAARVFKKEERVGSVRARYGSLTS